MFADFAGSRFIPSLPRPLLALLGLIPRPTSVADRLRAFPREALPLQREVQLRWDEHQVPYIEAQTDGDLAFTLGLVHAHLRGAQIEMLRLVAEGRLSEVIGPFGNNADHALRIMGFDRASEEIVANMPDRTRFWLQRFADGLTHYHQRVKRRPLELRRLGIKPKPWSAADVMTLGRLLGADFNWTTYFALMPKREEPNFARLWNRILEVGQGFGTEDVIDGAPAARLAGALAGVGRSGSNAVAVAGHRTETGSALIASDPHLGFSLPNIWILAGLHSPSFHVVGFMLVGMPFVCIGRNHDIAWGGTNLRAASTDLFDVSKIDDEEIETEEIRIKTRLGGTRTRTVRRTRFGPIISDAKMFPSRPGEQIALRWVGHQPSDEVTTMLRVAEARTPEDFRAAFEGYAVPAQTMVFADRQGNVGQVLAVTQPIRDGFRADDFVRDAAEPAADWHGLMGSTEMPFVLNPPDGVVVSANVRPPPTPTPIGFLFDCGDRHQRMSELLSQTRIISMAHLEAAIGDTSAPRAAALGEQLVAEIDAVPDGVDEPTFMARLRGWDGDYRADSSGAVAFETLLAHLVPLVHHESDKAAIEHSLTQWNFLSGFLMQELRELPSVRRHAALITAVTGAAADAAKYPTWGDMHRLKVAHALATAPLIGKAFEIDEIPIGGSRQTPFKTVHSLRSERHQTAFGSMARHMSDMSDEDANWFVLFGGQDGWLGSSTFADQVPMWRAGKMIQMPLSPNRIAEAFSNQMTLRPA